MLDPTDSTLHPYTCIHASCSIEPLAKLAWLHAQALLDMSASPKYRTATATARTVIEERGVTALWAGLAPRAVRIVGATFILNGTRNALVNLVEAHRQLET